MVLDLSQKPVLYASVGKKSHDNVVCLKPGLFGLESNRLNIAAWQTRNSAPDKHESRKLAWTFASKNCPPPPVLKGFEISEVMLRPLERHRTRRDPALYRGPGGQVLNYK